VTDPGTDPVRDSGTELLAMPRSQAAHLAAEVALANESLTAARLLLATDRVGDEAGNTVEGYLAEVQESTRRLYAALIVAQGVRPATLETGAGTAGATEAENTERRRLLYLLEQAQEVADSIGSAEEESRQYPAQTISKLTRHLRAELDVGSHPGDG